VKALVYLAAFAPEANEPVGPLTDKYPTALGKALRPDAAGFLYIACDQVHDVFAADLPESAARVVCATQKPVHNSVFGATIDSPAWKTIPSWYLVSRQDHALNPDLERFYAKRMGATTSEINASHVAFIFASEGCGSADREGGNSHPEVIPVIRDFITANQIARADATHGHRREPPTQRRQLSEFTFAATQRRALGH